jgi:hypothetical protein
MYGQVLILDSDTISQGRKADIDYTFARVGFFDIMIYSS